MISYLPWLLFFVAWFVGLRWATSRAFPEPLFPTEPGEEVGPTYLPSLFFHGSLVLALIGVLVTVILEDIRALWLAVPGSAMPIFIGCWIEYQFLTERKDNPLHLAPFWLERQWPFVILGVVLALMGVGWSIRSGSAFPLLFAGYSAFFMFQFWFFYSHCNGVTLSHRTLETAVNFPKLNEITTRMPRPPSLRLTIAQVKRWHRMRLWRVKITWDGAEPIEIVARVTPTQLIRMTEEFRAR